RQLVELDAEVEIPLVRDEIQSSGEQAAYLSWPGERVADELEAVPRVDDTVGKPAARCHPVYVGAVGEVDSLGDGGSGRGLRLGQSKRISRSERAEVVSE